MIVANKARPTAIYRLYDNGGALLYVGKSVNPPFRWEDHAKHDAWWTEVASKTLEWFTKPNIATIEHRKAIQTESPAHNPERIGSATDRDWCINTRFGSATAKSIVLYVMATETYSRRLPLDYNALTDRLESTEQKVREAVQSLIAQGHARIATSARDHPGDMLHLVTPAQLAWDVQHREGQAERAARIALRVKRPARPPIPDQLRATVYERDGHACRKCGATAKLTLDHVKPWSKGGLDVVENLQTLCGPCNSSKQDRIEGAA